MFLTYDLDKMGWGHLFTYSLLYIRLANGKEIYLNCGFFKLKMIECL